MPKCKVDRITKIINSFFTDQGKNLPSNDYDLFNDEMIDSMDLIELVVLLDKKLGIRIDQKYMTVDNFRSVNQIVKTIVKQSG